MFCEAKSHNYLISCRDKACLMHKIKRETKWLNVRKRDFEKELFVKYCKVCDTIDAL